MSHLALDRLEPGIDLAAAEQGHLADCARCRVEARLLAAAAEPADDLPGLAEALRGLDTVRERELLTLTTSLVLVPASRIGGPDPTAEAPAEGVDASRYRVVRWVGTGPLGPRYQVRERETGRHLALTVLLDPTPALLARIRSHLDAFGTEPPAGIAAPVALDEAAGTWAVATPFAPGLTLAQLLEGLLDPLRPDQGLASERERAGVAVRQVAASLSRLHARGLVHGHLAPARIALHPDGGVVLCDPGLWRDGPPDPATAPYAAPEVRAGAPRSADADRFALGALLHEVLSGQPHPVLDPLAAALCAEDPAARPAWEAILATLLEAEARDPLGTTRYVEIGPLGRGGMAEVRQVLDPALNRTLALKTVLPELSDDEELIDRFLAEAQVTAQLEHPGVVPVHHLGRLADGRPFFTMKQIRGRTLGEVIAEVHGAAGPDRFVPAPSGWTFRRMVEAFHRACETVAYAHARGVLHRDLKPSNVMVGDFGEVLVLDWGLARVAGSEETPTAVITHRSRDPDRRTRVGSISGTPGYMAPEQARGEVHRLSPASDVYSLGALLSQVLEGRTPGGTEGTTARPPVPEELLAIRDVALAEDPGDRYRDAGALGAVVRAWLDGERVRERARSDVEAAAAVLPEAEGLRSRSSALAARAQAHLAEVDPWAPARDKRDAWALEDEAAELRVQADLREDEAAWRLHAAAVRAPDLPEARVVLAELARRDHAAAEEAGDRVATARGEAQLGTHVAALPETHPDRARHEAYLAGRGAVTLMTDPPGAEVTAHRYLLRDRRLVLGPAQPLGSTPLHAVPLDRGSYLLRIRAADRAEVRYPVCLGRQEHWDGIPPGEAAPAPVPLPHPDDLGPDDCYVPAGWAWLGGDPEPDDPEPRRLWVPGFVIGCFPVTNVGYLAFLHDLLATGREDEALEHVPRLVSGTEAQTDMLYGRDGDRFFLKPDPDGDPLLPDAPVVHVSWWGAAAFARWAAEREGLPWRLPAELEWEKAARGVDRRLYPWGDWLDPSFCNMRMSTPGRPRIAPVDTFPVDESPYGVRGLAGNVDDWCSQVFDLQRLPALGERADVRPAEAPPLETRMAVRGGDWFGTRRGTRATFRRSTFTVGRNSDRGFRLARPFPSPR